MRNHPLPRSRWRCPDGDAQRLNRALAGFGLFVLTWVTLSPAARRPNPVSVRSLSLAAVTLLLFQARSAPAQAYDSTVFAALTWREIGIFRGGRSVAVAGSAARPNEYWFGTTGGGVFKSTDGGNTWQHMNYEHFRRSTEELRVSEANTSRV